MKILQTPPRFYPFIGGVENYVYNLSRELVKLGQDVGVVCAREPDAKSKESIDGILVKRLSYIGKIANTNITPSLPYSLLEQDFDIIHTYLPTPWSADWSSIVSILKRKPLIVTYQNDIVGQGFAGHIAKLYNSTCLPLLLRRASRIVITQKNYMYTSIYLSGYKNKITVLPIGVDIGRFKLANRPKGDESRVIFFLGLLDRYHRYKGLDELLEALVVVKKHISNVKLIVGGGGELLGDYRDMAESLGLSENVEFHGFIPDDTLPEYYNNCDAFVLPSLSAEQEGFGIVLLEAMACGRPVISTHIVGVAEDVERIDAGRIVRPRDSNALAGAILEILKDEEMAEEMGRRGRKLVEEKYDWRKIGRDMMEIYEEIA